MHDPYSILIAFGALFGLIAAHQWWKVRSSIDTTGEVVKGPDKRTLGAAATFTSIALALVSAGYLLGQLAVSF